MQVPSVTALAAILNDIFFFRLIMYHEIVIRLICVPHVLYFIYDRGAYFITTSCGW